MKRRNLVGLLGGVALMRPGTGWAQPAEGRRRIAFVHSGVPADQLTQTAGPAWVRQFFAELRRLGHSEGSGLAVERYSAEGRSDRYVEVAATVVRTRPDVIVMNSTEFARVFARATTTIPIVALTTDPVATGLVASLARPGGNLTGASIEAGAGMMLKRLQIVKEALPAVGKVAFLMRGIRNEAEESSLHDAARMLGVAIAFEYLAEITEVRLRDTFAEIARQRFDAVIVDTHGSFLANRAAIVAIAEAHRLPVMYPYRDFVELGGLLAYAPDLGELAKRLASDVHQILVGASPGDIPFFLPTKFDLVINVRTARALGIPLPQLLLAQADEVID
ncbi:MAG: ABC transporter substrate-binding protein [Alphaproteobacteria bacterium]|nr:ABC transporter substrate-binding protein [Alphaproteobacteria bacterium]